MNTVLLTISTLLGITVAMLVMGVLFSITLGTINVTLYIILGGIIGIVSASSVYWLLNNVK